jgi:hypothetical protein
LSYSAVQFQLFFLFSSDKTIEIHVFQLFALVTQYPFQFIHNVIFKFAAKIQIFNKLQIQTAPISKFWLATTALIARDHFSEFHFTLELMANTCHLPSSRRSR